MPAHPAGSTGIVERQGSSGHAGAAGIARATVDDTVPGPVLSVAILVADEDMFAAVEPACDRSAWSALAPNRHMTARSKADHQTDVARRQAGRIPQHIEAAGLGCCGAAGGDSERCSEKHRRGFQHAGFDPACKGRPPLGK